MKLETTEIFSDLPPFSRKFFSSLDRTLGLVGRADSRSSESSVDDIPTSLRKNSDCFIVLNAEFKKLTPRCRVIYWIYLKGLSYLKPSNFLINTLLDEVDFLGEKRYHFDQLDWYFYLAASCNMGDFFARLEDILYQRNNQRKIWGELRNVNSSGQTNIDCLKNVRLKYLVLMRKRPKKFQRKLGYTDHGSLGSDKSVAKLNAKIARQELEEFLEEKRKILEFLAGFSS